MTFLLNRPLPLNGSKYLLFSILVVIGLGCASSGPSSNPVVINTDKQETEDKNTVPPIAVDTVQWTVIPEEDAPPITDIDARVESYMLEKEQKNNYKVALMLPFRINEALSIPDLSANNKKFANFYSGFKLAASEVEDVNISVKTYYTNRDIKKLDQILQDFEYEKPDLIIGSYESEILSQTAEWALENRVALISPWLSSTKIANDNLFYLQLRPSITKYYEKMLEHVNYNYDEENVYIITRDNSRDKGMTRILHRMNDEMSELPDVSTYQDLTVPLDSLMEADSLFSDIFEAGAQAFILPHYSSRDESYVYSCLRKLYAEKGENDFFVYTMPLMLNSDRIDINILKNLQTRTCEFRFPNSRDPEVQIFRQNYLSNYGGLPNEDSYYGYDLMQFVEYGLKEHGQYFHYYMADEPLDLLQMKINIQPYFKNEDDERPSFMANEHLYIIEYDTDHFVIKDIR